MQPTTAAAKQGALFDSCARQKSQLKEDRQQIDFTLITTVVAVAETAEALFFLDSTLSGTLLAPFLLISTLLCHSGAILCLRYNISCALSYAK